MPNLLARRYLNFQCRGKPTLSDRFDGFDVFAFFNFDILDFQHTSVVP